MFSAFKKFGKLGALASSVARAWSPLALWPDGIDTPGMWISPRDLTSEWQDSAGTTPVSVPGTVADSSNPVGLAYDLRAGTPVLGPELVTNGDFSAGMAGWTLAGYTTAGTPSGGSVRLSGIAPGTNFNELAYQTLNTVIGRTYKISFPCTFVPGNVDIACYASGISGGHIASLPSSGDIYIQATSTTTTLTVYAWNGASTDVPFDATVGPATVKEVPGNHMLQSTSVDRPLLSARTNLLTYTEDFSNGAWAKGAATVSANATTAPDGTTTADLIIEGAGSAYHYVLRGSPGYVAGVGFVAEVYAKYAGRRYVRVVIYNGFSTTSEAVFDVQNGAVGTFVGGGATRSIVSIGDGWYRLIVISAASATVGAGSVGFALQDADASGPYVGDGTSGVYLWGAQLHTGSTASDYQAILTGGSAYSSTGFPIAQKYNGTNSSMATAAFAAGTLINGMDCMIPVRRDSAAATYLISNTGSRGVFEWESGDTSRPDVSAGTPTYYVDGVAVTATRGALFTALTAGDWHILEARGLDLSTWTALEVSGLVSYRLNGARGDIMLYPSTDPTEDKDAARQWLADYYGVTRP